MEGKISFINYKDLSQEELEKLPIRLTKCLNKVELMTKRAFDNPKTLRY